MTNLQFNFRLFNKLTLGLIFVVFSSSSSLRAHEGKHDMGDPYKVIAGMDCQGNGLDCASSATPFFAANGDLLLVWNVNGKVLFAKSTDLGRSFGSPVEIASHPKVLDTGPDARPQIVSDKNGNIFLAYAFFKDSNWNAQINTARSSDGGMTFSAPEPLITNGSSERFPSVLIRPDGTIFTAWIDKRLVAASKQGGASKLGGSIAYSFSTDGGKNFAVERIANEDSCECCRIGASLDPKGNPVIIYRAIFPEGIRDHATQVISSKGAEQIRRVSNDEWKTDACPHHGPTIAVSSAGTFHVAWFTQGKARSGVFYANSHNQGKTYSTPERVGNEGANVSRPYLLAVDRSVWLVWKEFNGQNTLVLMKKSSDDGATWSKPSVVSETTEYSDHPLLISHGKQVYLSWLTRTDGYQLKRIGQVE
jgi:hypothetical protein